MESYLEVRGRLEMLENETPCMFSTISSLLLLVKKLCRSWEKLKVKTGSKCFVMRRADYLK